VLSEALFRHLKIHAALVIDFGGGNKIEVGEWNFLRGLLVEYPEGSTGDRVVPHFFNMLVAENQRRRRFHVRLRTIARFHIGLEAVDLPVQLIEVALQSFVLAVWSGLILIRIRILIVCVV